MSLGRHLGRSNIGQTLIKNVGVCSLVEGGTGIFCRRFIFEAMLIIGVRGR